MEGTTLAILSVNLPWVTHIYVHLFYWAALMNSRCVQVLVIAPGNT